MGRLMPAKQVIYSGRVQGVGFRYSTKQIAANGGWVQSRGTGTDFLYSTQRGEGLSLTTGAGSTVGIDLIVVLDD